MAEVEPEAAKPKKHSPFHQVVFRKTGEAFDLGGKALITLSGVGTLLQSGSAWLER